MSEGTWDGPTTRLGDTSADYARWKAMVRPIRDLPEYKLLKLWKLNFSPKDIEHNKHWTVFPPPSDTRKRVKPGMTVGENRGRALTDRARKRNYAKVLLQEGERMLQFHRHDAPMLEQLRNDVVAFKALVESFKA